MDKLNDRIIKREEEYKQNLIEACKRANPDCEHLRDEEILHMNPLSDNDRLYIMLRELQWIQDTIKLISLSRSNLPELKEYEETVKKFEEDIEFTNKKMSDPKTSYTEKHELRNDIIYDENGISRINEETRELKDSIIDSLQSDYNELLPIIDELKGNIHVER